MLKFCAAFICCLPRCLQPLLSLQFIETAAVATEAAQGKENSQRKSAIHLFTFPSSFSISLFFHAVLCVRQILLAKEPAQCEPPHRHSYGTSHLAFVGFLGGVSAQLPLPPTAPYPSLALSLSLCAVCAALIKA